MKILSDKEKAANFYKEVKEELNKQKEEQFKHFCNTLIYETIGGNFGVADPTELGSVLGYYKTEEEAKSVLKNFLIKNNLIQIG